MRITKALLKKAADGVSYPYSLTLPIAVRDEIKVTHSVMNHNIVLVMETKPEFCDVMASLNKNKKTKFLVPIVLETIEF